MKISKNYHCYLYDFDIYVKQSRETEDVEYLFEHKLDYPIDSCVSSEFIAWAGRYLSKINSENIKKFALIDPLGNKWPASERIKSFYSKVETHKHREELFEGIRNFIKNNDLIPLSDYSVRLTVV